MRVTSPVIAGEPGTVTQAASPVEVFYYHADALGSVRLIRDAGGQVVATADFLPFGDDWQPTWVLDRRGFAGMERTPDTGNASSWGDLNYAGARYYSSQTGRFIGVDPAFVGLRPADSQTWNGCVYARNNPLRYVDPNGEAIPAARGPWGTGVHHRALRGMLGANVSPWASGE